MLAVRLHAYGGPDVVRLEDIPLPVPQEGEVLVKIHAASVNPVDWKIRAGYMSALPLSLPYILGCDFAGEIAELGKNANSYAVGQMVYGYSHLVKGGAFAEYVVVAENEIALAPEGISIAEAAGFPVAMITAWEGLFKHGKLEAGQTVLILGGAGGVGSSAVQLARWKGARVLATASARNLEFLRGLGAEALDYGVADALAGIGGVDLIFDTVGGATGMQALPSLGRGGAYVTPVPPLPAREIFEGYGVRAATYGILPSSELLRQIAAIAKEANLRLHVDKVFPLRDVNEALAASEAGRTRGKLILQP